MASDSNAWELAGGHERRRYPRRVSPRLTLRFEDHKYKTNDWSIGNFRIGSFHRQLRPGDMLDGVVEYWAGLRRESFEADVVRLTPEGEVCCRFLTLPRYVLRVVSRG